MYEYFESDTHIYIVMEYLEKGDFLSYLKRHGAMTEKEAKPIFMQILYGLGHIHCWSVLHWDIKLDNILIDKNRKMKICDFGVSKIIKKNQIINESCGTPAYLAPEIIKEQGYSGFGVDIWSLGILLFAMLNVSVPFEGDTIE